MHVRRGLVVMVEPVVQQLMSTLVDAQLPGLALDVKPVILTIIVVL